MSHLATTVCVCGHEFTPADIRPPLQRVPTGYFGSSVDRTSDTSCSGCGQAYRLLIKQAGQTWRVRSISLLEEHPRGKLDKSDNLMNAGDEFDAMDRQQLVSWLKENEVEYVPQWGDARLRETARQHAKGGTGE